MFDFKLPPVYSVPMDPKRAGSEKTIPDGRFSYRAFLPTNLQDVTITYTSDIAALIGEARAALAELKLRYKLLTKDKQQEFQKLMINAEVTASLKLADAEDNKADYSWLVRALPYAFEESERLPLSRRLLTEIHDMALHDPSHYKQNPGEFRRSPIWLGRKNATLTKGADFIPPAPDDMNAAFSALEHYMNEETETEPLVKAALIHYQFEMIHPFLDGNGRAGRILTLLCLKEEGLLPAPILPLSTAFLNQSYYYFANILGIERRGTYEIWIKYFLECIRNAAQTGLDVMQDL